MLIGVPTETKPGEERVALTPDGARELVVHGHRVLVQAGAGAGSSIADADYVAAGAHLVDDAEAWGADLVLKVKEPQHSELGRLRPDQILFTYLHLAAYPGVADALIESGGIAFGYETVRDHAGALPLLAPMSEVAGRLAPQVGAHFLESASGGRGVLLAGAPGVRPARVVVIGAGSVGMNAAWIAQGMEAEVILIDRDIDRLRFVDQVHRGRIMTLASNQAAVARCLADADLLIGAVLVPGGRAPVVVSADMVASMKPGSVIVDVAVDQGGCVETTVETSHAQPVVEKFGVLHYAVGNMPAAVPHTSTYALTNATLPYALGLADVGLPVEGKMNLGSGPLADALLSGLAVSHGQVVHRATAEALGREPADVAEVLA